MIVLTKNRKPLNRHQVLSNEDIDVKSNEQQEKTEGYDYMAETSLKALREWVREDSNMTKAVTLTNGLVNIKKDITDYNRKREI